MCGCGVGGFGGGGNIAACGDVAVGLLGLVFKVRFSIHRYCVKTASRCAQPTAVVETMMSAKSCLLVFTNGTWLNQW